MTPATDRATGRIKIGYGRTGAGPNRARLALLADRSKRPLRADLPRPAARRGRAGYVKGFRMPASHCARGCAEAGVRKASKEETAGGGCACGSVGLWGFKARFCATWPRSDGTGDDRQWSRPAIDSRAARRHPRGRNLAVETEER